LWRSGEHAKDAAAALRLTAQDLKELNLIDDIITEPVGGAHRFRSETMGNVGNTIESALSKTMPWDPEQIIQDRRQKFLAYGRAA